MQQRSSVEHVDSLLTMDFPSFLLHTQLEGARGEGCLQRSSLHQAAHQHRKRFVPPGNRPRYAEAGEGREDDVMEFGHGTLPTDFNQGLDSVMRAAAAHVQRTNAIRTSLKKTGVACITLSKEQCEDIRSVVVIILQ